MAGDPGGGRVWQEPRREGVERAFVWLVWAALLASSLWLTHRYTPELPYWDEWVLVPQATGAEPVTAGWLWSLHNEHRIVLPRLVYLAVGRLAGGDFRWVAYLNVLTLAAVAAAFLELLRRVRGRSDFLDAVFPLAWLHFGHAENLTAPFQVQMVLSSALVGLATLAVLTAGERLGWRQAAAAGGAVLGLPLSGANGVVLAPILAGWLVPGALRELRRGRRGLGGLVLGLAAGAVAEAALYTVNYHGNPGHPASPGLIQSLVAATEFVSMSLGPAGGAAWPGSAAVLLVLMAAAVRSLVLAWRREPERRLRTGGLLVLTVALAAEAGAVGMGRSGFGPGACFAMRYSTLAVPLVCLAYLALGVGGGRLGHAVLFLLVALGLSYNTEKGIAMGRDRSSQVAPVVAAIRRGVPPRRIARDHASVVLPDPPELERRLRMLRRARHGPYRAGVKAAAPPPRRGGEPHVWAHDIGSAVPDAAAAGDFDGDGRADVALVRGGGTAAGSVTVLVSTGTRFLAGTVWLTAPPAGPAVAGDFDGDGREDLAFFGADGAVWVARSTGRALARQTPWLEPWASEGSIRGFGGDADGDGRDELVLVDTRDRAVRLAVSAGGRFGEVRTVHRGFPVAPGDGIGVADVDGDGKVDLIDFAGERAGGEGDVLVALGTGTGFGDGVNLERRYGGFGAGRNERPFATDLNGDGRADLLVLLAVPDGHAYAALSGPDGLGETVLWQSTLSCPVPGTLLLGDVNGDGRQDAICVAPDQAEVHVSLSG